MIAVRAEYDSGITTERGIPNRENADEGWQPIWGRESRGWDKNRGREGDTEHLFEIYYQPGTINNIFHISHLIFTTVLDNIR